MKKKMKEKWCKNISLHKIYNLGFFPRKIETILFYKTSLQNKINKMTRCPLYCEENYITFYL